MEPEDHEHHALVEEEDDSPHGLDSLSIEALSKQVADPLGALRALT